MCRGNPSDVEVNAENEKFKAHLFLRKGDDGRYKNLRTSLRDGSHLGRNEYTVSVSGTYDLMNRTSGELEKNKRNTRNSSGGGHGRTGATFAQSGSNNGNNDVCTEAEPIAGNDGRLLPHISCYNCGNKGHYAGQCNGDDRRQNSCHRGTKSRSEERRAMVNTSFT